MGRRIASLAVGESVTVRCHGSRSLGNEPYDLEVVFRGIAGQGEDQRAVFSHDTADTDRWEAYRLRGHWCYGSSAERLSLLSD